MPEAVINWSVLDGLDGEAKALGEELRALGLRAGYDAAADLFVTEFSVDEGQDAREVSAGILDRSERPWRDFLYVPKD